jgi:hypothetical protein
MAVRAVDDGRVAGKEGAMKNRGDTASGRWRVPLALIALLLGARPRLLHAAIDVTGDWYLFVGQTESLVHLVQTGSSLEATSGVGPTDFQEGIIDSATGAFVLNLVRIGSDGCGVSLQGTVTPDSLSLAGTAYLVGPPPGCQSIDCFCSASTPTSLHGSRAPCGNRVVDPGEQCDDGPENGALGACCTATCQFAASGTICPGGLCDGTGMCSCGNGVVEFYEQCDDGSANGSLDVCCTVDCRLQPPGTPCADDGDLCTSDQCVGVIDTCAHWVTPSGGCATPIAAEGARVVMQTRRGRNRATFVWARGPAVQLADFGSPDRERSRLCFYTQLGHEWGLVAAASPSVSADGTWTHVSTGWRFKSKTGAPEGITRVRLTAATVPLKAKVKITAGGNPAFMLPLPPDPALVVQFKTSRGACWEATFLTAAKNTATTFKAKSVSP